MTESYVLFAERDGKSLSMNFDSWNESDNDFLADVVAACTAGLKAARFEVEVTIKSEVTQRYTA